MKTAIKDISEFLEFLKNEHLEDVIQQSQTYLIDNPSEPKFNPEVIKAIAVSSLSDLYKSASVKMPPYFFELITGDTTSNEYCKLMVEATQKTLLIHYLSDFTTNAEETIGILKDIIPKGKSVH